MSSHLENIPSITGNLGDPVTILNEFVLDTEQIDGGTRLNITSLKTNEVQTVDIMNGIPAQANAANQILVTDENSNTVWQERTHYEGLETAENVLQLEGDDNTELMVTAPIVPFPDDGSKITIRYNGTDYTTTAVAIPEDIVGISGIIGAGNLTAMGIEDSDESLPFLIVMIPSALSSQVGGYYGMFGALDGAEIVSVSIVTTGTVVHPLDDKYMGIGDFVITVAKDYTVSVEGSFADAWAMDERKLASSIKVVTPWESAWYADGYSVRSVTKVDLTDSPYYPLAMIIVDVDEYQELVDPGTPLASVTWRITWQGMNGKTAITLRKVYGLPDFGQQAVTTDYVNATHYLKHNAGSTSWSAVSLEKFAEDCPVQSVNSKIGAVKLTASDVGAEPVLGTFELIEQITVEEAVASITRSTAPDGTGLSLKAVCIKMWAPAATSKTGYMFCMNASGERIGGANITGMSQTSEVVSTMTCYPLFGRWFSICFKGVTNDSGSASVGVNPYLCLNSAVVDSPCISSIEIGVPNLIEAGTVIDIYGVKI